jgi:hypothetical protein
MVIEYDDAVAVLVVVTPRLSPYAGVTEKSNRCLPRLGRSN